MRVKGDIGARAMLQDGVSLVALAVLTGLLMAFGAMIWFAADDYCNWMRVDDAGVAGALRWLYDEWSGRLVTGLALYATLALFDLPNLRWASALCGGGLLVVALLFVRLAGAWDSRWRWPVLMFAMASLCIGMNPIMGQTVLLATGALVYLLPLVLLLAWIVDVRRLWSGAPAVGPVAGFAGSALLGNAIELLWPIVTIYVALMWARHHGSMTRDGRRALAVRAAGFALGVLVLATAPGNYRRAQATPDSFRHDAAYLWAQGSMIAGEVFADGRAALLLLAGAAVLAVATRVALRKRSASRGPLRRGIGVYETGALVLGGIASLTPMLLVPAQFAPRNAFYLFSLLLLAATALYADALRRAWTARPGSGGVAALVAAGVAVSVLASAQLAPDVAYASALRERLVLRDRSLRDAAARGESRAMVAPILMEGRRTVHFIDLSPDPGAWLNGCVARYYRLDSVRIEATATSR